MNISDLHVVGVTNLLPVTITFGFTLILVILLIFAPWICSHGTNGDQELIGRRLGKMLPVCATLTLVGLTITFAQLFLQALPVEQSMAQRNTEVLQEWAEDEYGVHLTHIDLNENDVSSDWSLGRAATQGLDATDAQGRSYRLEIDDDGEFFMLAEVNPDLGIYGLVETK